ncbi:MAG TPA: hypothetical protein VMQ44_00790 [Candidatus Saccharimonadales bacterium]|nr:hypothetical protein [Candidatus Saccharimonadales bacterium]
MGVSKIEKREKQLGAVVLGLQGFQPIECNVDVLAKGLQPCMLAYRDISDPPAIEFYLDSFVITPLFLEVQVEDFTSVVAGRVKNYSLSVNY